MCGTNADAGAASRYACAATRAKPGGALARTGATCLRLDARTHATVVITLRSRADHTSPTSRQSVFFGWGLHVPGSLHQPHWGDG